MPPFSKVLVANRGEIAIRVFRTLRELGFGTVAVYSEADRGSLHVEYADEAFLIGPTPAAESYLRTTASSRRHNVQARTRCTPATASSPRTPRSRARARKRAHLHRPAARAIEAMGTRSRRASGMKAAGVPIVPGLRAPVETATRRSRDGRSRSAIRSSIKAAAGGGGQGHAGRRNARRALERAFASARREGEASFGDADGLPRAVLEDPRHVEVQVLADAHGNVVHLGERDCSIQRRHQKLSKRRRRRGRRPSCASASAKSPSMPRAPSATAAPGRSSSCSTPSASTSSSR